MHIKNLAQDRTFQKDVARKILATADVNWVTRWELLRRLREIPELRTINGSLGGWLLRFLVEEGVLENQKQEKKTRDRKEVQGIVVGDGRPREYSVVKAYRLQADWVEKFLGISKAEVDSRRKKHDEVRAGREDTISAGAAEVATLLLRYPKELRWKIVQKGFKEVKEK